MKLLFIQDSGLSESIGIMNISAILKKNNHNCNLLIASEEKNLFEKIKDYNPDIIGFSSTTGMHRWVLKLAGELKQRFNTPIILGGPHPTYYPQVINNSNIDIICIGEGEYAILELLDKMEKNEDITKIENLWVKQDNQIIKNPLRPLIQDLDSLPLPDRDLYYKKYKFMKNITMKRFMSGRGCPYNCTFCHNPLLREMYKSKGGYIRKKSIERVVKEIEMVKNKYPLKTLHFSDDAFFLNKEWLIKFLELYKKQINLPFTCNIRMDFVDENIAKKLKEANCHAIAFGLECGNEHIRNEILKKQLPNELISKSAKILKDVGLKLLTTNMVGLPGETLEDVFETIKLNRKFGVNFTRINIFEAFPKLELVKYAKEKGYLSEDFSVETYEQRPQESVLKSEYTKEFKNLCLFAQLGIRLPFLTPLIKQLIKLPPNKLFSTINKMQGAYQEMKFFQIDVLPGIAYFLHTFKSFKIF